MLQSPAGARGHGARTAWTRPSARFLTATSGRRRLRPARRLGLPARYILHVGTLEPRKNLVRLIDAYYTPGGARPRRGHDLVLAGRKGWTV